MEQSYLIGLTRFNSKNCPVTLLVFLRLKQIFKSERSRPISTNSAIVGMHTLSNLHNVIVCNTGCDSVGGVNTKQRRGFMGGLQKCKD